MRFVDAHTSHQYISPILWKCVCSAQLLIRRLLNLKGHAVPIRQSLSPRDARYIKHNGISHEEHCNDQMLHLHQQQIDGRPMLRLSKRALDKAGAEASGPKDSHASASFRTCQFFSRPPSHVHTKESPTSEKSIKFYVRGARSCKRPRGWSDFL